MNLIFPQYCGYHRKGFLCEVCRMLMGELQDVCKKPFANLEQVESSKALVSKYRHGIFVADGSWHQELLGDGHSEWMPRILRKTNAEHF